MCARWRALSNRSFSHDVTAVIFVYKTMNRRPCLCTKNIVWELNSFHMLKAFFYSKQFAELLTTWLKRQRRRPWKCHWKIDSVSFQTISRFSEVVLLLKRRGFRLELKRGGSARVQTEMVEFIALPFSSSKKAWQGCIEYFVIVTSFNIFFSK